MGAPQTSLKLAANPPQNIFGAILAGGRSTRMGQDKRFLTYGDEKWLDRAVRITASLIGDEKVFICGSVPGRDSLEDPISGLGPMGGMLAVSRKLKNETDVWVLVLPVDMPLLDRETLEILLSQNPKRAIQFDRFELPFLFHCDEFARSAIEELCTRPEPYQRSLREFQKVLEIESVPLGHVESKKMINANTVVDRALLS